MSYHYQLGVIKEKSKKIPILIALVLSLGLALSQFLTVNAAVSSVTPSTNEINKTKTPKWAHANQLSQGIGTTDIQFVSERNFFSCFEYRTDGDTSQVLSENGGNNYNSQVSDGLYPYTCRNNNSITKTITADEYVEVRMVFGAENDERFDSTRFDVLPAPQPANNDDCKKDGCKTYGFKNQGQCIRYVNTGQDSRV